VQPFLAPKFGLWGLKSRNSLLNSLIAGKIGWRQVRSALRRQPASPEVSALTPRISRKARQRDRQAARLREPDLRFVRVVERGAAFGWDLGLVVGSSEVCAAPSGALAPLGQTSGSLEHSHLQAMDAIASAFESPTKPALIKNAHPSGSDFTPKP